MASLALPAEVAEVSVIILMAGDAVLRKLHDIRGLAMATRTVELPVCTGQAETRLLAVVELPDSPAIRRVATGALLAQAAFVHVGPGMAVIAAGFRILECLCQVALLARHGRVLTQQREIAEVVVKADIESPAGWGMTRFALLAELGGMDVVRCVAG
jgi:hypothetical protein